MPRPPRHFLPNQAVHLVRRGHNRGPCFHAREHYVLFLGLLEEFARETSCAVHAYVLMTNHIHLLVTPADESGPSRLMQRLGQRYAQYVNRHLNRTGALWEGRLHASAVTSGSYVIACYRYIEGNPVRARMEASARNYLWSSHRANSGLEPSTLLTPHPVYRALGPDLRSAAVAYRRMFDDGLDPVWIERIRDATLGNRPLDQPPLMSAIPGSGPVPTPV